MITQQGEEQASFLSSLEHFFREQSDQDGLYKIRAKAWDHFLELGLPSRKNEVYRYIKLRHLYSQQVEISRPHSVPPESLDRYIYPECRRSVIVFVNGHFVPSLSRIDALPAKVVVSSLPNAAQTYSAFLNNQWAKSMKEETDSFAVINAALHRDGAFIYVPPKTILEAPVQILHVVDAGGSPMLMMPRLHLFAGSQSEVNIVVSHAFLSGNAYFMNGVTEVSMDEASHVSYTQSTKYESSEAWHFDAFRATLKKNANLKTIHATNGTHLVRHDYRINLTGENADASLNGIWMLDGKREAHFNILMDHQAPHCRSLQLFKGALNGFSRSSFEGKILVRQAAQKTEAFQLNKNLLLSERAHADSKPNLEIFADDVKASHGATVGQLDEEQLFYMQARGIDSRTAKSLLVCGFYQDVIDKCTVPSVRRCLLKDIKDEK